MSSSYTKANASSPKNTNNITTSQVKESIDWSLLKEIKYNVERTKKNIEDCYTAGKNCNSSEIIKLSKNFKKENSPTKFIRQLNDEQKNCKFWDFICFIVTDKSEHNISEFLNLNRVSSGESNNFGVIFGDLYRIQTNNPNGINNNIYGNNYMSNNFNMFNNG